MASRGAPLQMLLAGLRDTAGQPLASGKVYTYIGGTSTPTPVFTDKDCLSSATNPLVLDSNGQAVVYFDGFLKIVVKTSLDATLYTWDNLYFGDDYSNSSLFTTDVSSNTVIDAGSGKEIIFKINGSAKWYIDDNAGEFLPNASNTYDIGSLTKYVKSAYSYYFSIPQTGRFRCRNNAGAAYLDLLWADSNDDTILNADAGDQIAFAQGGTTKWYFDTSFHLLPAANETYNIGSNSLKIAYGYFGQLMLKNGGTLWGRNAANSGDCAMLYLSGGDDTILNADTGDAVSVAQGGSVKWSFEATYFDLVPAADDSYNIGQSGARVKYLYTHNVKGGSGHLLLDGAAGTNVALRTGAGPTSYLEVQDSSPYIFFPNAVTATSATAGARTLPANPQDFLVVNINGTQRKIPYYAT